MLWTQHRIPLSIYQLITLLHLLLREWAKMVCYFHKFEKLPSAGDPIEVNRSSSSPKHGALQPVEETMLAPATIVRSWLWRRIDKKLRFGGPNKEVHERKKHLLPAVIHLSHLRKIENYHKNITYLKIYLYFCFILTVTHLQLQTYNQPWNTPEIYFVALFFTWNWQHIAKFVLCGL